MHTKKPLIIGHRGAAGHQPENTLASIEAAIELGADMIEIDVHVVEGQLYAFHDHRLERLTGSPGKISRLTINSLSELRVQGHKIPSLTEVVTTVLGRASLNIELKGQGCAEPMVEAFAMMLDLGFTPDQILVSSYDHDQLYKIKHAEPRIRTGVLVECRPLDLARLAEQLGAYSIHTCIDFVSPAYVLDAHNRGLKFIVYTVNYEDDVNELIEMGVDGIISDYPGMARRAAEEYATRSAISSIRRLTVETLQMEQQSLGATPAAESLTQVLS